MKLTRLERETAVWKKLSEHLEDELQRLRKQNDCSLGVDETAKLRGKIAATKSFLALGEDDPAPELGNE